MKTLALGTLILSFVGGVGYLIVTNWVSGKDYDNWKLISEAESMATHALPFSDFFFFDKEKGISISAITIQKTDDGGRTWLPVLNWDEKGFSSLIFTNNKNGWIVGSEKDKPLILKTENGGLNWRDWHKLNFDEKSLSEINGKFTVFNDLCFDSKGKIWIAGDGGVIEATMDGLTLTASSSFQTKETIFGVSCNDSGDVWSVGEESTILHYQPQKGWTKKNLDNRYLFRKVFSKGNTIWILGGEAPPAKNDPPAGVLLQSQDNGKTLEDSTPESARVLNDLHFVDGKGWLIGNEGSIYYTTDNGNSWTKLKSFTRNDLHRIFFLDSKNGWIVGDRAIVLKHQK